MDNSPATTVTVGSHTVAIYVERDERDDAYLRLEGVNCGLEGMEPCLYYPTPLAVAR